MDGILQQTFEFIHSYATHPLVLAGLALLLILYQEAAKRSRALPRIPVGLIVVYLILETVDLLLRPHDIGKWSKYLDIATTIALYAVVVRFLVAAVMEVWLAKMRKTPLPTITRDFVLAVAMIVVVLWVLRTVGGINLASLLTTSAILTAVVGLALQDTLGSFFAGLSLQIERPYQIGDWIQCKGFEGKVIGISWRTTRIRTRFNELIYIPNNEITKDTIKNYAKPDPTHIAGVEVSTEYGAPPNKVRRVMIETIMKHPNVDQSFIPKVWLRKFNDFSIDYIAYTKFKVLDTWPYNMAEIRNELWYAFRRNGIRIPFPIRDVNMRMVDAEKELKDRLTWIETSLRRVPVLGALSDEHISQLARGVSVEEYAMGEQIVIQGNEGDSMYLIQAGVCDVIVEKKDVHSQKVATLKEGDFFGEMSLLTGERRTATVRAQEDAIVLKVDKKAFGEMIATDPNVSEGLAQALATRQAELKQITAEKTVVETNTKTFLARIKSVFGLS